MKIVLVAIDSKFIHTNLALRYLRANCDFKCSLLEFTIKDDIDFIARSLINENADVLAFSAYLWNIKLIEAITKSIKAQANPVIVLGGPEVSYDSDYYIKNPDFDYIITGEGEFVFNELMHCLNNHLAVSTVHNLVYRFDNQIVHNKESVIDDLNLLKDPYYFVEDIPNLPHKIQYLELSRGCPFHCSYCLAALENQVRFFAVERLKTDLLYLMDHGAKTFKFLDRTFNINPDIAMQVFQFIIANHRPETVFQFEITGDILPESLIQYINKYAPKHLFRFEIGVQSTNDLTNTAVDRHQNTQKLLKTIRLIKAGDTIDLHLDLIAGLPFEDRNRFETTFNDVFALRPKELQLGFLKLLRGTKIRNQAFQYAYVYQDNPPYEIVNNAFLSSQDLAEIHLVDEALNLFWNKNFMPSAIEQIAKKYDSLYHMFALLGEHYINTNHSFHKFKYIDPFIAVNEFVEKNIPEISEVVFNALKYDYLSSCKTKAKLWWDNQMEKTRRIAILRAYFSVNKSISIDDLIKYSIVTDYIDGYLIAFYHPNNKNMIIFKTTTSA
ncbi:MAG: DUF4080 domain-containing protein [Candidatus Izemoplasmatales bacterium]|nr:DUF4080 domain-containing protein [Candidatus Izemoplasmatales bacterium]